MWRWVVLAVAYSLAGCHPKPLAPGGPDAAEVRVPLPVAVAAQPPPAADPPWFSGLVVSQLSLSNPKGAPPRDIGEQHFYISQPHFRTREFDESSELVYELVYDPERNLLYQLAPEFTVLDAAEPSEVSIRFSGETGEVLGHRCLEILRETPNSATRACVAPSLRFDPRAFDALTYHGWAEQSRLTDGALEVEAKIETEDYVMSVKAIRIEPMALDEHFWELETARRKASDGG